MASETFISSGRMVADAKSEAVTGILPSPLLTARNVSHSYGQIKVVEGVSLEVMAGESVAIISPSGSGKSTLLRLLLRLEKTANGETTVLVPPSDIGAAVQEALGKLWLGGISGLLPVSVVGWHETKGRTLQAVALRAALLRPRRKP